MHHVDFKGPSKAKKPEALSCPMIQMETVSHYAPSSCPVTCSTLFHFKICWIVEVLQGQAKKKIRGLKNSMDELKQSSPVFSRLDRKKVQKQFPIYKKEKRRRQRQIRSAVQNSKVLDLQLTQEIFKTEDRKETFNMVNIMWFYMNK